MFYNLVLRSEKSEAVMLCPSFDCMVASKSQNFDLSICCNRATKPKHIFRALLSKLDNRRGVSYHF